MSGICRAYDGLTRNGLRKGDEELARNIAKRFANMRFVYWPPKKDTTEGGEFEAPVEVMGKYFTDDVMPYAVGFQRVEEKAIVGGGTGKFSALFYMTEPEVQGAVSLDRTMADLRDQGLEGVNPNGLDGVRMIKTVQTLIMLRAKTAELKNKAFIVTF